MKHWATSLIGKPWKAGQVGPDAFDCWGLVQYVQREHYGRVLPTIAPQNYSVLATAREFANNPERARWQAVVRPQDGDVALLAHAKYPSHVGVWLNVDGGGLLHCVEGQGVIFQPPQVLRMHGWGKITYYGFTG